MNILLLHSSSDLYGASKIFLNTIDALKDNNKLVVCLSKGGPLVDLLKKRDIKVHIFELAILRRKYYSVGGLFNRFFYFIIGLRRLRKIYKQETIDIIYSNTTAVLIGAYAAKFARIKHVWHVHEIIKSPQKVAKFLAKSLYTKSVNNIAVSEEVSKYWCSLEPRLDSKIQVIFNGLDLKGYNVEKGKLRRELNLSKKTIIIGMVARINHWKGQKYFIEIAKRVFTYHKNVHFVLIGDVYPGYERYEEEMHKKIEEYSLSNVCSVLGFRSDVREILPEFDIFVLPSILPDPLPTTVLEAMASSCPVVGTNHGGVREMVKNNESGILIPWDDANTSYKLMKPLIEDENLRRQYGNLGFERVSTIFTPEKYAENIKLFFDEI
jgi:glycosyltransferase involved in cell wall biosynthesis